VIDMSRRQFGLALAALLQAPVKRQTPAPAPPPSRAMSISALADSLRGELAQSGAGTWEKWLQRLEPTRAAWKQVAAGSLKGRNGYIFNKNALNYLIDTDLESGLENTKPLEVLTAFDKRMKGLGIDFIYVPIPAIEEVYPENFLDMPPADLTVQPATRHFMLSLLERDVEVVDLLRPFQAARDGYRLGLKRDDHWNDAQIELAASVVARRLRRYDFVRGATAQAKRYTTKAIKIEGERGITTMKQVITPAGTLYEDVDRSPILAVGDSNLQVYEYATDNLIRTGEHAGFTAHLAHHLGVPLSLEASGGFRPAQLNREPELFQNRRVVIFVGAAWVLSYEPWNPVSE
jgi:hypothetical protein